MLALPGLVARQPELEREVIVLRFFQDLDQDASAGRVGYSQMHVSACSAGPWRACMPSCWSPDSVRSYVMVLVTLDWRCAGSWGSRWWHAAARTRRH